MTGAAVALLLGVAGLVAVVIGFPIAIVVARQEAARTGLVARGPLVAALLLGVVAVVSIVLIVGVVVLS